MEASHGAPGDIRLLVVRPATEIRDGSYWRIQGALANVGHEAARGTIANLVKDQSREPAPERERKITWKEFLSWPREVIAAADFFTIEAGTRRGLTRFLVLFLSDLSSRRSRSPDGSGRPTSSGWVLSKVL